MEAGRSYRSSKRSVIGAEDEWLASANHSQCEDHYSQ